MNRTARVAFLSVAYACVVPGCARSVDAPAAAPVETSGAAASTGRFGRPLATLLTGTWEGTLARREPLAPTSQGSAPDDSGVTLRIDIDQKRARVFLKESDEWTEAMPGRFVLRRILTNAALVGVNVDDADEPDWIENWAILVTAIDDDSLQAEWTRVVNNLDPGTEALPAFSMAATGVLKRTSH